MPAWGNRCSDNPWQDDHADYEPPVCPIGQKACGNVCNADPKLQCLDFFELWTEDFMKGFPVDLGADHKIDEGFDERLSSFVLQKGQADTLFPLTQHRMVLFGYISALKKLTKFLDSLFDFNPERDLPPHTHYSTEEPDKETSLDPPIRDLMVGSGRSMFDCRDDKDKSVSCPTTLSMDDDINWKQRNGTHFKRHVFEQMHVLPQYLTTKTWGYGLGYVWKSVFFIAETDSDSYMGERAVNLYKDAYHAIATEDLIKFVKANDKFFSCSPGPCNEFEPGPKTPTNVAVALVDENGFYSAIEEALGLNKDVIKFEPRQDSWLDGM
ncbi:hypothetical protein HDU86_001507 [Geranomyces michiganensis]|nr:hypothetical protein HDU86_001507 [Geranomyces michiganensis]